MMKTMRVEAGWRLQVAQAVLRLLFGYKNMYVSPFKDAGVGTALVLLTPQGDKALLQQRAGAIEGVGKWGLFGGFVNLKDHEPVAEALAREVYEESLLTVPAAQFRRTPDYVVLLQGQNKNQMSDYASCGLYYFAQAAEALIQKLRTSDEVSDFKWFNEAEIDALWQSGRITGLAEDHYGGMKAAFAQHRRDGRLPELVV